MARKPKFFQIEKRGNRKWLVIRTRLPSSSFDQLVSNGLTWFGLFGMAWIILTSVTFSIPQDTTVRSTHPVAQIIQRPKGLSPSRPVHLDAPDIALSTDLIELGKNADDSLETPTRYDIAGWYKFSPTPGEVGPSIITGHVDNYLGPAVFFYLKDLQAGEIISVKREDGSDVTFTVDKVELFDQQNFPTEQVYGDIDYPGLRLITCGGTYNALSGHYSHNVVVYASYIP